MVPAVTETPKYNAVISGEINLPIFRNSLTIYDGLVGVGAWLFDFVEIKLSGNSLCFFPALKVVYT